MRGRAMDGEVVSRWWKERWDPGRPQRSNTIFLQQGAAVANNYKLPGRNARGPQIILEGWKYLEPFILDMLK